MSKRNSSGSYRYWNRLIRDHAQAGKDRTKSKHLSPPKNERVNPEAYILTDDETPNIVFTCYVCYKASIYPAGKSGGRQCQYCGGHTAATGFAKKVGEACADKTI